MSSSYGSLWPGVPASANVVKSQNVYNTATTPLTVIGSGGGGSYPANAVFNSIEFVDANTSTLVLQPYEDSLKLTSRRYHSPANGKFYVENIVGISSLDAYRIPSYPMAINASTLSLNVQTTDFTNNALVNVSTINGTNWSALVSTVAGLPR